MKATWFIVAVALALVCVPVLGATYSSGKIYPTTDGTLKAGGQNVNQTFAELLDSSGDQFVESYAGGSSSHARLLASKDDGYYNYTRFGALTFAKPAGLLSNDTVDSAAMCLRTPSTTEDTGGLGNFDLVLVGLNPSDPTALTAGDYPKFGKVPYAQNFTRSSWGASKYNCFNFTAAGLNNVSKTGYTSVAAILNPIVDSSAYGVTWANEGYSSFNWYAAAYSGTTLDPYLEFTWTTYDVPEEPPVAAFSASKTAAGYNAPITFTDASTNVPSSWNWSFGDGNLSTDQNPVHIYSPPGTYTVNLTVTNAYGSDSEVKTSYITIGTRPNSYLNPYTKMIPWLQQADEGWCSGFAAAYATMLMRYNALGIAPSASQEPFTREVPYVVDGTTVYSDTHVYYTPSPASIYWPFDEAPGDHYNSTALAEVMKTGYNLASDQITSKHIDAEYYYPANQTYLDSHRYNPITSYVAQKSNTEASWELLKQNISVSSVPLILIDTYSNNADNSTTMTLDDGSSAIVFANPTGSATNGHYLAVVGWNDTADQIYVLNSWGEARASGTPWTKMGALNKAYWTYGSTRQNYFVPTGITINEVSPAPVANFSSNVTEVAAGGYIQFNDTSTNNPTSWLWTIGYHDLGEEIYDQDLGKNPVIYFENPTNYTVSLTATNADGSDTETKLGLIYVHPAGWYPGKDETPPGNVEFISYNNGCTNGTFYWSNPSDTDFNYTYTMMDNVWVGNLSNVTNSYYHEGLTGNTEYTISTYTVDLSGNRNPSWVNWTVNSVACGVPTASFTSNATYGKVNLNSYIQFNDTSTGTPPVSWSWYLRNTTSGTYNGESSEQNPVFQFSDLGNWSVTLYSTSESGSSVPYTEYFLVSASDAPVADFIAVPTSGEPGLLVSFTDMSLQGSLADLTYNWSFGDGSYSTTPYSEVIGNVQHVYAYAGVYDVSLNVTNDAGTSIEEKSQYIVVSASSSTTWYSAHQVEITVNDKNGQIISGATVTANAIQSTLPGGLAGAEASLVGLYGISSTEAAKMVSTATSMSGTTGTDGAVVFTAHGSLKYRFNVTTTTGGTYSTSFYPIDSTYTITCAGESSYTSPNDVDNSYSEIANSTLTFYEPNASYFTLGVDYLDIAGKTSALAFYTRLESNGTYMNWTNVSVTGAQHLLLNKTYLNKRAQQWTWGYYATREV